MRVLWRAWTATALVGVVAGAGATVAEAARPYEAVHWAEEFDFITDRCGVVVRIASSEGGNFLGRASGDDGLPQYTATWRGESTWTNLATRRAFTFRWSTSQHDVAAVDNGDGTSSILWQSAGSEHIYGPDGQRLYLVAGLGRALLLIDNGGTPTNPFDDAFISTDFVSLNGRPESTDDFCAAFRDLTG